MAQNKNKPRQDWHYKKIENIAIFKRGKEPGSASYNRNRVGIRFIRVVDMSKSRTDIRYTNKSLEELKLCKTGDILIVLDGSPGIVRKDLTGAYSSGIRKVVLKSTDINYNFLYFILKSNIVQDKIAEYSQGITIKHASSALKHIDVPIPPLEEQKKIAYILSKIEGAIDFQEKLVNTVKLLKKAMMHKLFTEGIGHKEFKDTEIGRVPKSWSIKRLDEASTIKGRIGWQGLTTKEYLKKGDYLLITGTDFESGKIDWDNCVYVSKDRYLQDVNIQVESGDVLLTKDGTIGKLAYVENVPKPATLNSGIFLLRNKNPGHCGLFLYYLLDSEIFKKFIKTLSAGTTIIHLFQKDLVAFKLPLPQIEEQKKIAYILSSIDSKIRIEESKKDILEQLFLTLLNKLMSGEIRTDKLEVPKYAYR